MEDTKEIREFSKEIGPLSWSELDKLEVEIELLLDRLPFNKCFEFDGSMSALIDLMKNAFLKDQIHAKAAWKIFRMFQITTTYCKTAAREMGFIPILAEHIMLQPTTLASSGGSKNCSFELLSQLCCLRCLNSIASVREHRFRKEIISSGVLEYLADAYRTGNMFVEIQNPLDLEKGKTDVFEVYCDLLQNLCNSSLCQEENFFQSVICILADALLRSSGNPRTLKYCLCGISQCLPDDLSRVEWPDVAAVSALLLRALDSDIQSIFTEARPEVISHCIRIIQSLSRTGKFPNLLGEFQIFYHRLARSSTFKSQIGAAEIALRARNNYVDYFGFEPGYVPSFRRREALEYFFSLLSQFISSEFQGTKEALQLICEFATETYQLDQLIDFQDNSGVWCAAEITEVDYPRVRVHKTGTGWTHEEWIAIPSQRIAPAFTFTRLIIPLEGSTPRWPKPTAQELKQLCSCKTLGVSSEETARNMCAQFGYNIQYVRNHARWLNRENLKASLNQDSNTLWNLARR
eukprot:TRINITY_DN11613_c0_g1_i1.p1 TRINITY_DN11613_c0_g1~~TRINITY_DN11613_c0_g1_i1.p1  ORF type:complete len:519 (-),score=89.36 TRINITY_DN11613_c0_g1_i1:120-1676(-)